MEYEKCQLAGNPTRSGIMSFEFNVGFKLLRKVAWIYWIATFTCDDDDDAS
jgi:hypothetical protein